MKKLFMLLLTAGVLTACSGKTATITQDEFKKLEEGMTAKEVEDIIGGAPKETSMIDEDTDLEEYTYEGEGGVEDDSYAALIFKDGKLNTFIENGLVTKDEPAEKKPKEEKPAPVEVSRQDEIEDLVEDKVKADYDATSISEIAVNEDMGKGEGYIVLAHLSFDRKNRAKTAKDMISMYAQDLGATLADQPDINEVTVFFEVPYLKEGNNIYKLNMQRQGDGMAIIDEFADPNIF